MLLDESFGFFNRFGLIALLTLLLVKFPILKSCLHQGFTDANFWQYPFSRVIYNLYFSPLANFPGPRAWAASRIPFIRSLIRGTIVHDVEKIHRKYGAVARIAPNEISFANVDAWTDIFRGRPGHLQFPKDPIWWGRQPGQAQSLISANDPEDHARMRKLLSHSFTEHALKAQEPILQKYIGLLVERLRERATALESEIAEQGLVDIVPWLNYTTFDIFGDLGFGESFDCLQHSRYHPWIKLVFNSVKASSFIISARFYPLIESLLRKCIPRSVIKVKEDHYNHIVEKVQRRINWEVERPDIMSHVIKHNNKKGMTLEEIQVTFMVLTNAGSETTATVLNGCLSYLMTHPDKLSTLMREVRGNFTAEFEMTLEALRNLPYLNAVINESLRLCPPIPTMLPRLIPKGGDTVCGRWMPGGVSDLRSHDSRFSNPMSSPRLVFLWRVGHSSVIQRAFTGRAPLSLSAGFRRPGRRALLTTKINEMPCKRSAWARGNVWATTWPGLKCVWSSPGSCGHSIWKRQANLRSGLSSGPSYLLRKSRLSFACERGRREKEWGKSLGATVPYNWVT